MFFLTSNVHFTGKIESNEYKKWYKRTTNPQSFFKIPLIKDSRISATENRFVIAVASIVLFINKTNCLKKFKT